MSDSELDGNYPGVGRLHFFLGKLGLGVGIAASFAFFGDGTITHVLTIAFMIAGFVLDTMRLRNIGVSQWFAFLRLIPYVNLVYMIGLQSAQAGWGETRRLDKTGITLALFQTALFILLFFMAFRMNLAMPSLW